jgi:hypothetical protein
MLVYPAVLRALPPVRWVQVPLIYPTSGLSDVGLSEMLVYPAILHALPPMRWVQIPLVYATSGLSDMTSSNKCGLTKQISL